MYSKQSEKYTGNFFTKGMVNKNMFSLLIDISSVRSEKVINALTDFFVYGHPRNQVCERHNVNPGYLSVKIKELQLLERRIKEIAPYYLN
ncbi:hypothetical protein HP809_003671 [Salmonella enterica subsp. enterica serovar Richmond]|nr:hypothetical protein [Salmonella enterica]EBR9918845.1 hypothetical protein [Salmonella enterica subsp. enterica serovar Richmond]EBV8115679.1 hypothetical protein [Salmonella enterica subsp. enterica serovar Baildon]ECY4325431.1 hypothetical protein [Salmonella enterica subsp. enterica serovar Enteritidis]EEA9092009.1 hypothetical protein [Salmonella enterica subsp. enterica]EIC4014508.1 hypothetical protein [Salmonella enterica subsp. enterica serovar Amager]